MDLMAGSSHSPHGTTMTKALGPSQACVCITPSCGKLPCACILPLAVHMHPRVDHGTICSFSWYRLIYTVGVNLGFLARAWFRPPAVTDV